MAEVYTLTNRQGISVRITDFGAIIMSLIVPDRDGRPADVVLGFDNPDDYLHDTRYLGAVVGRYANRIGGARFTLDGLEYLLPANNGRNHLHGGRVGFNRREFSGERRAESVVLSLVSPDREEGYPGRVELSVTYALNDEGALSVEYRATTDRATPINLTQHSYFNLAGRGSGTIDGHVLQINAGRSTEVDAELIPTGRLVPVDGTGNDFRRPRPIADGDYDLNYVLDGELAATVRDPGSGRTMDVRTTEPGLQFYSGGPARDALCLETQHWPDSPNQKSFPSTILRPGEEFRSRTVYTFSAGE